MSDKLDRFTKRARRVLTLAQEEALRLNHNYIGTEHLLLGLVREENGVAVKVLRELGVEPVQIIRAVERTVGRGERPPFGKPTLAPRTKRVIELAVDEARLMGHHYIGTEHLLLGLVREGEGIAVNVLRGLGINLDRVRTQTARNILQNQAQSKEKQKKESKTPLMDQLGYDMTAAAEEGKLDPVVGRQQEIERVIQILSRRTKNNPAQRRADQRFDDDEYQRRKRANPHRIAFGVARNAQTTMTSTAISARPLVMRWKNSITVAMRSGCGITSPLHSGQWLPQPAPEPLARTNAPQTITKMFSPSVPQAYREKRRLAITTTPSVDLIVAAKATTTIFRIFSIIRDKGMALRLSIRTTARVRPYSRLRRCDFFSILS